MYSFSDFAERKSPACTETETKSSGSGWLVFANTCTPMHVYAERRWGGDERRAGQKTGSPSPMDIPSDTRFAMPIRMTTLLSISAPATAATTANVVIIPSRPPKTRLLMYSLFVYACSSCKPPGYGLTKWVSVQPDSNGVIETYHVDHLFVVDSF